MVNTEIRLIIVFVNEHGEAIYRGGKNTQKNCTKKIFTTQRITMV